LIEGDVHQNVDVDLVLGLQTRRGRRSDGERAGEEHGNQQQGSER
jgi:hypothetical protein